MFKLHPQLEQDCFFIADLNLSQLLLMNDANYPWLILVPRLENLREIIDLDFSQQSELLNEINLVTQILKTQFSVDKFNIANLGNVVEQLHIHIIVRKKDDATFPKPVWGNAAAKLYSAEDKAIIIDKIRQNLKTKQHG